MGGLEDLYFIHMLSHEVHRVLQRTTTVRAALLFPIIVLLFGCSSPAAKTGPRKVPPPPQNFQVHTTAEGLRVDWEKVPGASHYTVFWGTESQDYRNINNFKAPPVVLAGLKKGKLYAFAATSWNEKGESDYSKEQVFVYDDNPRNASLYAATGNNLMEKGSYEEALVYLSAAIRLDPHNVYAYQQRALLYERVNRTDLAKRDHAMAQKILKTKPLTRKETVFLDHPIPRDQLR